ncbi:MAG: hypothetical protein LBE09_04285 [Christensenellaceae bacterium]|nr:hypothetical protein [Christensenellaceae bacterium]
MSKYADSPNGRGKSFLSEELTGAEYHANFPTFKHRDSGGMENAILLSKTAHRT